MRLLLPLVALTLLGLGGSHARPHFKLPRFGFHNEFNLTSVIILVALSSVLKKMNFGLRDILLSIKTVLLHATFNPVYLENRVSDLRQL